jgi:hydrogenase maturation protease
VTVEDARDATACIVCVGENDRGDDAVGPLVAEEIRRSHPDVDVRVCRDPFELLDAATGADIVVVVDAARVVGAHVGDTATAGSVVVVDDCDEVEAPSVAALSLGVTSTHGFGPAEVLALGRNVDGVRARVVLVAVAGQRFGVGAGVSDAVAAAVPTAAEQAVRVLRRLDEAVRVA